MSRVCTSITVYGLVQGVGFRYYTQHLAKELGLEGYVRNLDDGSVEVVACGDIAQVEKLHTWLKQGGPHSARIKKVLIEPKPAEHMDFHGFNVRY